MMKRLLNFVVLEIESQLGIRMTVDASHDFPTLAHTVHQRWYTINKAVPTKEGTNKLFAIEDKVNTMFPGCDVMLSADTRTIEELCDGNFQHIRVDLRLSHKTQEGKR